MKTLGPIAGAIGAVLAVTSLLTFATSADLSIVAVKLGVGLVLIGVWALTNRERLVGWARALFFYSSSLVIGLGFVALLAATNFIVAKRAKPWDLTTKKIYTLSPQTTSALAELHGPVKLIAFVEEAAPDSVEQLLRRYAQASDRFSWEFKDPRRNPDLTQRYAIHKGQLAAVLIGHDERYQVINLGRLADPRMGEQELTNGLLKLGAVGQQKLYFVVGHGEWPLEPVGPGEDAERASLQVRRPLEDEGYAPASLNLIETGAVPEDASAVVIAAARSRFSEPEKKALADYLTKGGRLLYFAEPGAEAGLDALLERYGVQVEPGLVADAKVNPEQPFIVVTPFLGEHEIVRPLAKQRVNLMFATTRAVTLLREGMLPGVVTVPLVLTTPYAWAETTPSEHPVPDASERSGTLTLAAVASRPTEREPGKRTNEARVAVFGDSELLVGTFGLEPNRNLVMNTFAWATAQAKKITLRPPDRDLSNVDITPRMLTTVRLLAMDVLPTLLIGLGLTIWLTRRAR
jgi:ABC-type uncharacterized transport system involved in gliding motility auxiliary subunit